VSALRAEIWAEIFPALSRPISKGNTGEAVMVAGESTCFLSRSQKGGDGFATRAGGFCAGCRLRMAGKHFCPGCLESGRKKGGIIELETARSLHGQQALLLSILPFASRGWRRCLSRLRYWESPRQPGPPAALARCMSPDFGDLQTVVLAS